MADINIPKTDNDLKDARIVGWDLVVNKRPYDVFQVPGFAHSIGGGMGENDYYCCPADIPLTIDNMEFFNGKGAPTWEVRWKEYVHSKCKWNEQRVEHNGKWQIFRNDELFYEGGGRSMDYGLSKAQTVLFWMFEGPIAFHMRNWRDEVINRKIYYHQQPGIIESIIEGGQLCVMIKPDGIDKFNPPPQFGDDDWWNEDGPVHKTSMEDPAIYWFRD